ncbi:MAG: DUF262 domain-containing protein [Ruminococcaceae bacterium]|nr:DUF262 domain-containing protein [Oscillospiraceae bacterium]
MGSGNEPLIKSISVSQMFGLYNQNKLIVNRKYQRKLCWTIEEKRNFIDTIMNNLPVPMFLLAEVDNGNLEIIDGMQRLDAICSLIEQKYSLKSGFFDLETMPDTIDLVRKGKLLQKGGKISSDICKTIANYPLPVSIFTENSNRIEEAFKRINSTGKHLSLQELRQVGVNSKFATLVRDLSAEVRGDVSENILLLNNMSNISLSNHRLNYGIFTGNIFWINNEVINTTALRASRDEEIIAFIIANMILTPGDRNAYNADTLNKYYGYDANPLNTKIPLEMTKIEDAVDRVSVKIIKTQFNTIFSLIREMLEENKSTFKNCVFTSFIKLKDLAYPFQAVFMAIYTLIYKDNLQAVDRTLLYKNLKGIGNDLFSGDTLDQLRFVVKMNSTISFISGKIRSAFSVAGASDPAVDDWTMQCTNIIMKSRTEQNFYDYKIGLTTFGTKKFNIVCLEKIIKSLTAINNIGPNHIGYILIGVADNLEAAENYKKVYGISYKTVDKVFITGIEAEAIAVYQSIDRYTHNFKEYIQNTSSISEPYKLHIIQNMFTPLYYGKQLIVLRTNFDEPVMYNKKLYQRMFTDVEEVDPTQYSLIYKKFFI